MASFAYLLLILAMVGHSSASWCVCKQGSDAVLQKTLDYACGAGADCNPIKTNGPCYNPDTVRAHCNYAVNSYFQRKGQAPLACDFAGTATIVTSDPSTTGCSYPASASSSPGNTSPTTATGTPSTTLTPGNTPVVTNPNGGLGGVNSGMGPTGMNTDVSGGGILKLKINNFSSSLILLLSGLVFCWA